MKTLKEHTILYDKVCPMCNAYTSAFVKTGILDKNGRLPYQNLPEEFTSKIDCARAVNEIALINKQTGEVNYGIRSLFIILGNAFPFLAPLFRLAPFAWLMDKVYKFISYNRRVIMPSSKDKNSSLNNPAFNLTYRILYLVFTWLATALILFNYSTVLEGIIPASNFYREFLICGGQIFWQLLFISFTEKQKSWDYLGNMMTISFAGGLLLLVGMLFSKIVSASPNVSAIYFAIVAGLMLLEHIRRTKALKLHWSLSATWVLYRVIILIIIILYVQ